MRRNTPRDSIGIRFRKPEVKLSFDVTQFDGSPLQNRTSDILVGDDGTLFRTQFQAEF